MLDKIQGELRLLRNIRKCCKIFFLEELFDTSVCAQQSYQLTSNGIKSHKVAFSEQKCNGDF